MHLLLRHLCVDFLILSVKTDSVDSGVSSFVVLLFGVVSSTCLIITVPRGKR